MTNDLAGIIKVFFLTSVAFVTTVAWTPLLTHFLYRYRLGKQIRDEASAPIMAKLHAAKSGTPTMGGVLVWGTTLVMLLLLHFGGKVLGPFAAFDFFSREQTLLPAGALLAAALVGLVDDYFGVRHIGPKGGGLRMRHRLLLYTGIALIGALWFYFKLDWDLLHVPFVGNFNIGWWYMPFFVLVIVATSFSVNGADGLDGLAGGILLTCFAAYGTIAFVQGKTDLAAFCGVIVGALLAFLWFNINPARFFMGDTGAMSLGVTLGIVAMLTNAALLLPIIGITLVIESLSVIIQMLSKRFLKRKVFLSTPIHHHLEAKGWPEPKVVMRFWVVATVSSVFGLVLALVDFSMFP
ncbi:MAG: phospho-N-acetylmuramoyl-pentapeptide-transferase [Patescibacteria group bacterium]|nr:phospho-N-acetylmuramoyl-pentapeptide-transferase [Patescibacteria group bacterium]